MFSMDEVGAICVWSGKEEALDLKRMIVLLRESTSVKIFMMNWNFILEIVKFT